MGPSLSQVTEVGNFIHSLSSSNFFGLLCPSHCGAPSIAGLAASFIAGLSLGIAITLLGLFFLGLHIGFGLRGFSLRAAERASPSAGRGQDLERLRGYLHAR